MKKLLIAVLATILLPAASYANQTVGESTEAAAKDVKRATKKGMNRVKEAVCMEGDMKCAAKKLGNRVDEATEATKDKATEMKDKVDTK